MRRSPSHSPFLRLALPAALAAAALIHACGITEPKYIDYTEEAEGGAAADGQTDGPPPVAATYATNVKAVLDAKCATSGCHVSGAQSPNLSTFAAAKAGGPRSQVRIAAGTMPPSGGPLPAAEKALFKAWVDASYPE